MKNTREKREPLPGGMKIIQNRRWPCFTEDAVLLAHFAAREPAGRAIDFGCGNGIIPLLLSCYWPRSRWWGIEIMPKLAQLAERNMQENDLQSRVTIINDDLCQASTILGPVGFDLVTSNPPYQKQGCGRVSNDPLFAATRSEILCTLQDVVREAALLLAEAGRLVLVQRYDRLAETQRLCQHYGLVVTMWQAVRSFVDCAPHIFLLEARKVKTAEHKQLPDLVLRRHEGGYTREGAQILNGGGWADD